jgi:hypothetical protein
VPFDYYRRLSKKDKRTYDASDAIRAVPLEDVGPSREAARALTLALEAGDKPTTNRAAQALADRITTALGVEPVRVKILARRPTSSSYELHGLYVREEGKVPVLRVWMRTSAYRAVVKPRTFVRTLLHEVGHHLDFTLFGLDESFHTEGFFRRESDLVRKVLGASARKREREAPTKKKPKSTSTATAPSTSTAGRTPPRPKRAPDQLCLFGDAD